jgi:hypothetical protein
MAEQEIAAKEKHQGRRSREDSPDPFFLARVDIYEFHDSFELWVDMPGIKESDAYGRRSTRAWCRTVARLTASGWPRR